MARPEIGETKAIDEGLRDVNPADEDRQKPAGITLTEAVTLHGRLQRVLHLPVQPTATGPKPEKLEA